MFTTTTRLLFGGLIAATAIVCAGNADAAIRFHSGPSVEVDGTQVCTSANISGLGNTDIVVSFDVRYRATTTCRNHGGNVAPGQPLVSQTAEFTSDPITPKNGRAQINECSPSVNQAFINQYFSSPNPAQVCPNGNWTVDPIRPGDVTVYSYSITAVQGSTTLYTCNSSTQSCSR